VAVAFSRSATPILAPRASAHSFCATEIVVIPALPGFGFSGPTREPGWTTGRTAAAWAELMRRLGYDRFGAQGGDFGALVSPELGRLDADHVVGVHLNAATAGFILWGEVDPAELDTFSDVEKARLDRLRRYRSGGNASTRRPGSWPGWSTSTASGPTRRPAGRRTLSRDAMLTNIMLYWLTGTAGSAARLYYENMHQAADWGRPPATTPTGVAVFAEDKAIRRYGEQAHNIVHWSDFDTGGHFAAMEAPDLLVGDIRTFFRSLR
jgi:pimeloyl-ACP methyl ester carboxylesterase